MGGTKVCSNGPCHMTRMAAMSINGKTFKCPIGGYCSNLVYSIRHLSTTNFVKTMTLA